MCQKHLRLTRTWNNPALTTKHNEPSSQQMGLPHARGLIYCEPIEGLLLLECCSGEDQLQLAPDQYSESDC